VFYGARAPKICSYLKCPEATAQNYIDDFWNANPGVRDLIKFSEKFYTKNKFIVGLDGRKIPIRAKYKILNTLVQGAAAIVFKRWLTMVCYEFSKTDIYCRQILNVHDEGAWRCHKDSTDIAVPIIERCAKEAGLFYNMIPPVTTDCKVGRCWADVH
jgi:DNA polymerase I